MINIQQALQRATDALIKLPDSHLEAQYLVAAILNKTRAYLMAFPERQLTAEQTTEFTHALQRREQGEPLAYIVAQKEFWSLMLAVSPAVLIPRPETELLVETVLTLLPQNSQCQLADLGTGSGAIALALASERPSWNITASDISAAAIGIARQNASQLAFDNVIFKQGDWCSALEGLSFDLIVSNPPYIDAADTDLEAAVLEFEPTQALIASENGLAAIRKITQQAACYLVDEGYLCFEHGHQQADAVAEILRDSGFKSVVSLNDINGLARVSYARKGD